MDQNDEPELYLQQKYVYGSSRVGKIPPKKSWPDLPDYENSTIFVRVLNEKFFEISNHLGNVHLVVLDYRSATGDADDTITGYHSFVATASEYYPPVGGHGPDFGQLLTDGNYSSGSYRFGFQGQEMDDEIKGTGNSYDFGARIYDSRIGRYFSVDPKSGSYPWQAPYAYHRNTPVVSIDFQGEGDPPEIINGVYFIKLKNPTATIIYNEGMTSFTQHVAGMYNDNSKVSYSINLQQYGVNNIFYGAMRAYLGPTSGSNPFYTIGQNVSDGKVSGTIPEQEVRAYGAQDKEGNWSFGLGQPPKDAKTAFGGGIPLILNGELYGQGEGQTEPEGYSAQKATSVGKVLIGYNSKDKTMMIVVSPDDLSEGGMTLDQIRDKLYAQGYDNLLAFDGSDSATLIEGNDNVLVEPARKKDNTIPAGLKVEEN